MKALSITTLAAALTLALSSQAVAEEVTRLVVKPKAERSARAANAKPVAAKSRTLEVTGDADAAVQQLLDSGLYERVEKDVIIRPAVHSKQSIKAAGEWFFNGASGTSEEIAEQGFAGSTQLNDVHFYEQYSWMNYDAEFDGISRPLKSGSNILKAYHSVVPKKKLTVAVLDGGFPDPTTVTDLVFESGYNWLTFDSQRDEKYYEDDLTGCDHGYGVASTLGAKPENEAGTAGTGDFNLVAATVLDCGVGYLSDAADALMHHAGGDTEYYAYNEATDVWDWEAIPGRATPVDVVNMSLGGSSGECPEYMQDAVDFAISQGVAVVVAAGNDNESADYFAPANCDGVITVGALELSGNKANFSNYGDYLDIAALGEEVVAACQYGEGCWWSGTSFASPLVASMVALVKQEFPELTPAEFKLLLQLSANETAMDAADDIDLSCADGRCGTGVADADALLVMARRYVGGELFSMRHALDGECNPELYIDALGEEGRLCQLYKVSVGEKLLSASGQHIQIYRTHEGGELTLEQAELLIQGDTSMLLSDIDPALFDYGIRLCEAEGECADETLFRLNDTHAEKPTACN